MSERKVDADALAKAIAEHVFALDEHESVTRMQFMHGVHPNDEEPGGVGLSKVGLEYQVAIAIRRFLSGGPTVPDKEG